MKIKKQKLENFKLHEQFEFIPNGHDATITADNAVGKSTLYDAHLWLLFGKDSRGKELGASLKTLGPGTDEDREPIHGLTHSVEEIFDTVTLKKTLTEDWTTKKGSADSKLTSHITKCYIDGVEKSITEYERFIAGVCSERQFRLLSDPLFANTFTPTWGWKDLRAAVVGAVGDITDADVIETNPDLQDLPDILGDTPSSRRSVDDHKAVCEGEFKRSNDELKTIPGLINENRRNIPSTDPDALKGHEAESARLIESIQRLQTRKAEAASGGQVAELNVKARELDSKALDIRNRLASVENPERVTALRESNRLTGVVNESDNTVISLRQKIQTAEFHLGDMTETRTKLRAKHKAENEKAWTGHDKCPTCNTPLPEDQVQAAKDRFNEQKAIELEAIVTRGKKLSADIDAQQLLVDSLKAQLAEAQSALTAAREAKAALVIPGAATQDPANDPEYQALAVQKREILAQVEAIKADSTESLAKLDEDIETARRKLSGVSTAIAEIGQAANLQKRVVELGDRQKELAGICDRLKNEIWLCEEFTRTKVDLMRSRISIYFPTVQFRMFKKQINGGIEECCTAMVNGVPWEILNTAARINAGLEIIDVLGKHLGVSVPVFVDNAESVHHLTPMSCQVIRLVFAPDVDKLMVEIESKTKPSAPYRDPFETTQHPQRTETAIEPETTLF